MTPPPATAAATGHARALRRGAAPRGPRRVSGPARGPRPVAREQLGVEAVPRRVSGPAGGAVALPRPRTRVQSGPGLARRLAALAEHPWLDRLLTGRIWIGLVAVGLIGLVFMQVSLLKLNAGMGRAVERSAELDRTNSLLRADVSRLEAGDRIQSLAQDQLHMVLPAAGQVTFIGRGGRRVGGDASAIPALAAASTATPPTVTPASGGPATATATATGAPTAAGDATGAPVATSADTATPSATTAAPDTTAPATTAAADTTPTPPDTTAAPPDTTPTPTLTGGGAPAPAGGN